MDLLRYLLLLPMRLLRALGHGIGWLLRPVIGNLSWSAPEWMHAVERRPRQSAKAALLALLVVAGGWLG